jgi:putative tryptophan/tyrosine transport system substrate-binding protein
MNRKTLTGWVFLLVLFLGVPVMAPEAQAGRRIGMLLWNTEGRYLECRAGILAQLREEGFAEPAVKFISGNAEGSKAKLAEWVRQFEATKPDLILTVGTMATLTVAREIKDIPVVFSTVYDPVAVGIAEGWKSSGNNTTGASTRIPMSALVSRLKEVVPARRLAVLYTPGEKQTELQVTELQKISGRFQLKVLPILLSKKEEVAPTLAGVLPTVDALVLTGSSVVGAAVPAITDMASRAKVVTITSLADVVDRGALLGVCANPYRVGRLSGKKAAQILQGANPALIPIETEKRADLIFNVKTAQAGEFRIPAAFMKKVTRTIQ